MMKLILSGYLILNLLGTMKFELPQLPYSLDALEPVISKETLEYHYGKHLQAYIDNLNALIKDTPFENKKLEEIISASDGAVFNNAAQTWNHIFYFYTLSPTGGGEPKEKLKEAIDKKWGSFEHFKKEFSQAANSLFGSGWVWLTSDADGNLSIEKESNAGNPITRSLKPLLTIDVWEHAYYLDHQNRRAEYTKGIWDIIDWGKVEERYND